MSYMKTKAGRRLDTFDAVARPEITGFSPALVDGVSSSSHPTVLGTGDPYNIMTLYLNEAVAGTGTVSANGTFAIALTSQLNGTYNLLARGPAASTLVSFTINDPTQPLTNSAGVPAVFEMDNLRSLYYTNGTIYTDLASLVGAIGGTLSGSRITAGGYVNPDATNLLSNGDFASTTTGWTPTSGTLASVSSEAEFTSTSASASFSQALTGFTGRGLVFKGTGRRGTHSTNPPSLGATLQNATFGANNATSAVMAVGNVEHTLYISASPTSSCWFGVKNSTSTGVAYYDNFSVLECMPLLGWTPFATSSADAFAGFSVVIDAIAPAALPGAGLVKVIWQGDTNTIFNGAVTNNPHNWIRLVLTETGAVQLSKKINGTVSFTLTLGTVTVGQHFRAAFGASAGVNSNSQAGYAGSLNGANAVIQSTSVDTLVGVTHMRIGRDSVDASQWDGTMSRVAIVRGRQANDWLESQATLSTASPRLMAGDSYTVTTGGVSFPDLYEAAVGQPVYTIGVGGSTFAQIRDSITSRAYLRDLPLIIWDGSSNGMVDVASQVAIAQQIWDWKANGRVLFLPSIAVPNPGNPSSPSQSAAATLLAQYRDALIAAFGAAHVFDTVPVLQALGNGGTDDNNDIAAGLIPRSIMLTQSAGEVHLGSTAMNTIATNATFQSKVAAL